VYFRKRWIKRKEEKGIMGMQEKQKQIPTWRRLDNSAKIFPVSTGKRYSTVFRISAVLKETIKPAILEQAVKQAL
jgi:hypothetical protein